MAKSSQVKEHQKSKPKRSSGKPASTFGQSQLASGPTPENQLAEQAYVNSVRKHADLLSNPSYQPKQRQSLARQISRTMGNQYLRKVMVQMKKDEERQRPPSQPLLSSETGEADISETCLPNGQVEQSVSIPVTQVISRQTENSEESAGEHEPEPPIHVDEILGEEEEGDEMEEEGDSSISSNFGYKTTVNPGGDPPEGFGVTWSLPSWRNVDISSSIGTLFNRGTYTVKADFNYRVRYRVRSSLGPRNQLDIASDTDSDIKAGNYQFVAKDLTPRLWSNNGRPRRSKYWAKDLTLKHEKYHAKDRSTFGADGPTAARTWLNAQTSTSSNHVRNTLLPQALDEGTRAINLRMNAPPGKEERAYGDGIPDYTARADSIKTKGDAGDYGKIYTKVKVKPKGGGTYTVVPNDTLAAIALRTYGDASLWPQIRDANPGKTRKGGHLIYPGTVLNLPLINIDQKFYVSVGHGGSAVLTETATVASGASKVFLVDPKDIFTEATNNTGNVTIEVVDEEANTLKTLTWAMPTTTVDSTGDFEITAKFTS